ncbi:DUF397 domain-containing protein [Streptomyces beijiangensis]|uniref:DUF397 domain-containing protein n=2 Tax=Streptomyces beijiangensis TaxID=163361 RepID=A0A939JL78_9ACTN|nr:DUF397 domain-containing protein [Streptomyces beijiangensis]
MIRTTCAGDGSGLEWFKSSDGNEGDCVEIATPPGAVHVRDSKNADGPRFAVGREAWAGFVAYAPPALHREKPRFLLMETERGFRDLATDGLGCCCQVVRPSWVTRMRMTSSSMR